MIELLRLPYVFLNFMFGRINRDLIFLLDGDFSAPCKGISTNFGFLYTKSLLISREAYGLNVCLIEEKSCINTCDNDLEMGQFYDAIRKFLIFFM